MNNEDYANVEKNIEKIKSIGKFVVVKDKLADFETNMDVAASEWSDMLKGYFPQEDKAEGQYILAAAVDTTFPVQDVFYTGEKESANMRHICKTQNRADHQRHIVDCFFRLADGVRRTQTRG